ncbi:hypothetical protein, variant [Puccinia triticina 1-1 BBBD Race 1]|uniref:Uncharacterized protein n=2 Tax=Puccinia triticina TaxID=208348 RepID=A0A0C4EPJ3_PUCT1|nr:uncharacterized protein PtA15_6A647 [Puccinia triticina]OAV92952.1 hypothetical protein PTTG_02695 [Puccinia triticina 1-1 BBBD Race 1]OAV92953.1 hypothetical protein, variant [Puccinia triticina 1-1 BBBD Race 1]WAQ86017.1 hypothetical protein PtA15_6A647 [Puccinia triticina]WAR55912.1 hypothetical protein PtB15_6B656 [Puccinia triticina]
MDSLHPSLSQALPLRDYDAEQALQAPFRAAALGIATFYKKASENGRKAYSLGYSSALQDVLAHLQTALDQLDSPNSQDSMASTVQRVVDYIQRRQEALRAESQDPNDEDGAQPSPAPQHGHRQSTTPPSRSTLSPTSEQALPPTTTQEPTSTAPSTLEPGPLAPQSTRRRTSPRRMTPVNFQPSHGSGFGPARQPSSPTSTSAVSRPTFNLNFSSFAASPLPQHQQPSSTGPTTTTSSSRRHRSGPTEGARKGKVKERANERSTSAATPDPTGLFSHGYSHYTPSTTSSFSGDSKTLSSVGNKRRFPADSTLDSSPLNVPPQPVRITRRTPTLPIPSKSLATPIDHPLNQPPSAQSPDQLDPPPTQIHLHTHPHHNQDDVLMLLQASPDLHDNHHRHHHQQDGIERASKRFFSCKNLY